MSNDLDNTELVTRFSVKGFINSLGLAARVDRQVDNSQVFSGKEKYGDSVKVRRPVCFEATNGAVIGGGDTSAIEEGTINVPLSIRKKVVFEIPVEDETLKIEELNQRYILPATRALAQTVETAIAELYKGCYNFVGSPGTKPSTFLDVANANAKLNLLGVPSSSKRYGFYGSEETVKLADGLKLNTPSKISTRAIESAEIGALGGATLYMSQSLAMHTVGVATGSPKVNGAGQSTTYALSKNTQTQTLVTDGWTASQTGIVKAGDVITLAGVYGVNRVTGQSTGVLAQLVVMEDADSDASGNATFTIREPLITSGAYKTVTNAPSDNATITVVTGTGGTSYRQNIMFDPNAVTLAFARLKSPTDKGVSSSRISHDGVSLTYTRQFDITDYSTIHRLDIYCAAVLQNPAFMVRTTS